MTASDRPSRLTPSLLARKILCAAYGPAPLDRNDWIKLRGFHAAAMIKVISRHLQTGYELIDLEKRGPGYRIDLLFRAPSGRTRIAEVKSGQTIREVHKLQGALYPQDEGSEIVVSTGKIDEILSPEFIQEALERAETTRKLIMTDPQAAMSKYTPHPDVCPHCSTTRCPFRSPQTIPITSTRG